MLAFISKVSFDVMMSPKVVLPMRKLQNTAAGIPTVSQDTMVNNHEDAKRRKAFSTNMTWGRLNMKAD